MLADSSMRIIPTRETRLAARRGSTARIVGGRNSFKLQQKPPDMTRS